MKRISFFFASTVVALASDQATPNSVQAGGTKVWLIRAIFAAIVIVCSLLWAVKNKFTDYP